MQLKVRSIPFLHPNNVIRRLVILPAFANQFQFSAKILLQPSHFLRIWINKAFPSLFSRFCRSATPVPASDQFQIRVHRQQSDRRWNSDCHVPEGVWKTHRGYRRWKGSHGEGIKFLLQKQEFLPITKNSCHAFQCVCVYISISFCLL